jgi:MFS family permease
VTDQLVRPPAVALSPALAEPTARVSRPWIGGVTLANMGLWMASYTPVQILLANQAQAIAPHGAEKFTVLSVVLALGAVATVLTTPIVGALSDRTHRIRIPGLRHGRGRRHVWTLAGALISAASMLCLAGQHTIFGLLVFWFTTNIGFGAMYASLTAAIPDHVPVGQRATVAGWTGMPQALGLVVGAMLVTEFVTGLAAGYLALSVLLVACCLPFVLLSADHPLGRPAGPPLSWRNLAGAFAFSPRQNPDFGWAWITRCMIMLGNATGTLYLLYFLRDAVHYKDAEQGLLLLIVIYTVGVVVTALALGVVSDRMGRRKPMVVASGAVMAAAALCLTFWETWPSALAAAALFGIGFGCYIAVDQALITEVLPAAAERAKDLGVINIANVGSTAVGTAIAAPVVALGGFPSLYILTAVALVLGGVFVLKISSVRLAEESAPAGFWGDYSSYYVLLCSACPRRFRYRTCASPTAAWPPSTA